MILPIPLKKYIHCTITLPACLHFHPVLCQFEPTNYFIRPQCQREDFLWIEEVHKAKVVYTFRSFFGFPFSTGPRANLTLWEENFVWKKFHKFLVLPFRSFFRGGITKKCGSFYNISAHKSSLKKDIWHTAQEICEKGYKHLQKKEGLFRIVCREISYTCAEYWHHVQ